MLNSLAIEINIPKERFVAAARRSFISSLVKNEKIHKI